MQQGQPPSAMRHSVADVLHPPHAGSVGGDIAGPRSGGCHQNLPQAVEPVGCRRAAGTLWHSATRGPCVSHASPRTTAPACFCWPTRLPVTVGFARGYASASPRVGSSLWCSRGGFASVAVASRSARLSLSLSFRFFVDSFSPGSALDSLRLFLGRFAGVYPALICSDVRFQARFGLICFAVLVRVCLRSMCFGFSCVRPALFFRFASCGPVERLPRARRASLRSLGPLAPPQHRAETKRVFSICAKACL